MSPSVQSRALSWVGFVGDLLQQPLTAMPHDQIIDQLRETFDVTAGSYNWAENVNTASQRLSRTSREGIIVHPVNTLDPIAEEISAWRRGEFAGPHALVAWHLTVGGPRPYSSVRVPASVLSMRDRAEQVRMCTLVGCEHQVAIHTRLGRNLYHCYVISRSGTDFTDDDLAVAHQIQRVVIGLDRQVSHFERLTTAGRDVGVDAGLTTRELTILSLLAQGLTTQLSARRLQCSPRTVHKHLERIYRKLGVRDRVNAVRIAQEWNLVTTGEANSLAPAAAPSPRTRTGC